MDEEITWVVQAQHGSDEAFTKLVEAYQIYVYNLYHCMLGESESDKDITQKDSVFCLSLKVRYAPADLY